MPFGIAQTAFFLRGQTKDDFMKQKVAGVARLQALLQTPNSGESGYV